MDEPLSSVNLHVNLEPNTLVPVQITIRGDRSVFIWVGNTGQSPALTSLILAHPSGPQPATILISNQSGLAMEAGLAAARRFSKKYQRPLFLSYPPHLMAISDEETFKLLEVALRKELDLFLNPQG